MAAFYELVKDHNNLNRTAVVGIEHLQELADFGRANLNKEYSEELNSNRMKIVVGDGRKGYENEAPYDVIHVGASAPVMPIPLIKQLKVGG